MSTTKPSGAIYKPVCTRLSCINPDFSLVFSCFPAMRDVDNGRSTLEVRRRDAAFAEPAQETAVDYAGDIPQFQDVSEVDEHGIQGEEDDNDDLISVSSVSSLSTIEGTSGVNGPPSQSQTTNKAAGKSVPTSIPGSPFTTSNGFGTPSATSSPRPLGPKAPLPRIPVVPYKATIIGLVKASKDCRSEMLKIMQAVGSTSISLQDLCQTQ